VLSVLQLPHQQVTTGLMSRHHLVITPPNPQTLQNNSPNISPTPPISLRWLPLLHLRGTHDKQLLELTCLFPTRSTTFGRLLLTLALAHRASTCYSLESISVPALLCTGVEIGYPSCHCRTSNCRSEMTESVQVVDRE